MIVIMVVRLVQLIMAWVFGWLALPARSDALGLVGRSRQGLGQVRGWTW